MRRERSAGGMPGSGTRSWEGGWVGRDIGELVWMHGTEGIAVGLMIARMPHSMTGASTLVDLLMSGAAMRKTAVIVFAGAAATASKIRRSSTQMRTVYVNFEPILAWKAYQ